MKIKFARHYLHIHIHIHQIGHQVANKYTVINGQIASCAVSAINQYIYINICTYNIIYIFSNICINIYNIMHINSIMSCANIMQLQISKHEQAHIVCNKQQATSSEHSHATSQPSKPSVHIPGKLLRRQSTNGPQYAMLHIGQNFYLYIIHKLN